jgi:hypothetical protein
MAEDKPGQNYLLVDVGHVLTHAAYVTGVEGTARLAALAEVTTTRGVGSAGLLEGVRRVTANLEAILGRQIMDGEGALRFPSDSDGHGVDAAVVTTSLVPPLRVALIGLTRDFSLASAIRAVTLPYISLVRTVSLEASGRRWETSDLEALVQDPPDAVVIAGGVDGGPVAPIRDMGEALSAAYALLPAEKRPLVIFAGNQEAHRPFIAAFANVTDLRLVANVRPSTRVENLGDLRQELTRIFYSRGLGQPDVLNALSQWAGSAAMYDLDAEARTLRFLARRYGPGQSVLGVDVGGHGTRVVRVPAEGAALTWATSYGTGAGLAALRSLNDPLTVVGWTQHDLSWAEVWDRLSNIEVRPAGVPQSPEDWDLQQAAAREALSRTWNEARLAWTHYAEDGEAAADFNTVVGRGTVLTHALTPGQAALILIDALQPVGVQRLALDWANLLPGLSALAQIDPTAAVQVFDSDVLMDLGTLIAPRGLARPGSTAMRARLVVRGETRSELNVPAGSICRLPLGVNETAQLELYPARSLELGLSRRGRGSIVQVRGGALGVIIDARGRPLRLPLNDSERRTALEAWQREIEES